MIPYGTVFINEKYPYALKIFMKDAAYMRWLKFCMKNQDNPFVPKIRGKVTKIVNNVFAVRIEKLKPYRFVKSELNSAFSLAFDKSFNSELSELGHKFDKVHLTGNEHIDSILKFFKENEQLLDLHYENMMIRQNGQIVIIDPLYNWFRGGAHLIDPHED